MCVCWEDGMHGVNVIGRLNGGSLLTYAVASTGVKYTLSSFFGILWKVIVFQEFRVRTQSQDLKEERKQTPACVTLTGVLHIEQTQISHNANSIWWLQCCGRQGVQNGQLHRTVHSVLTRVDQGQHFMFPMLIPVH